MTTSSSSPNPLDRPINDLLSKLLDDDLDGAELCDLADQLRGNSAARQLYYDHIALHTILRWIDGGLNSDDPAKALAIEPLPSVTQCGSAPRAVQGLGPSLASVSTTFTSPFGYFSSGWPVAYLIATVILGIGLVVGAFTYVSHPGNSAVSKSNPRSPIHSPSPEAPSVGRITGMVDCKWADESTAAFNGAHVALGRKYTLASGLMEITYDTGAKVILQGSVTYQAELKNGGYLSLGKLTGKVEVEKAKGFVVRTPTAVVTDLGTEFGVAVSEDGDTTSHVYRGSIRLQKISGDGGLEGQGKVLHENESACVERFGANCIRVLHASTSPIVFARKVPATRVVKSSTSGLVVMYTDRIAFEAATTGNTTIRYGGLAARGHVNWDVPNPFTRGGVGIVTSERTTLYASNDHVPWIAGREALTANGDGNTTITPPANCTAFGVDICTFHWSNNPPKVVGRLTLTDSTMFTFERLLHKTDTAYFLGFVNLKPSVAISSVVFYRNAPDDSSTHGMPLLLSTVYGQRRVGGTGALATDSPAVAPEDDPSASIRILH